MRKNIPNYTFNYDPLMLKFILSNHILDKNKDEDKIFLALVDGYTARKISKKYKYAESTIWNRRRDIYNKTKKYML